MSHKRSRIVGVWTFFLAAPFACGSPQGSTGTRDAQSLTNQINHALNDLTSLAFDVVYSQRDRDGLGRWYQAVAPERFHIIMARGHRLRVEKQDTDGRVIALVVCDGRKFTEYVAEQSKWTRYPVPKGPTLGTPRFALIGCSGQTRALSHSWLDGRNPFSEKFENAQGQAIEIGVLPADVDGIECQKVEIKAKESQAGMSMRGLYELFVNPDTYLPFKRVLTVDVKMLLLLPAARQIQTTTFDNVTPNAPIGDDTFRFDPPADATFVPPDDESLRRSVPAGSRAPDLHLAGLADDDVSIREKFGSTATLVSFWQIKCAPCIVEMKSLKRLYRDLGKEGLTILGVNVGDKKSDVVRFLERSPLPYALLLDEKMSSHDRYYVWGVPHTVLVDSKGVVVKTWQGWRGEEQEKEIRDALAELGIGKMGAGMGNEQRGVESARKGSQR